MSNSSNIGAFVVLIWFITILISIGSGILAWRWVDPQSFWGAVVFLIAWGVLSKIGHLLAMGFVALLSEIQ